MAVEMRPNRAKRMLKAGHSVLAPSLGASSIPDLDTLDLLGSLGLIDVAWIEMEHGPATWRELSDVSRVCDLWGITSLVRVNENNRAQIGRVLDRGVQSILVPHVTTRAEAEQVVEGALYAPQGVRGIGPARQGYAVPDYFQKANDETLVVILVEDLKGIANLPEIVKVEGIDCIYIGPSDLAQTMGPQYLGQPFHPDVQAIVRPALETVLAAGRAAGTLVEDSNLEHFHRIGVRFFRFSALAYLQEGLKCVRARVADTNGAEETGRVGASVQVSDVAS